VKVESSSSSSSHQQAPITNMTKAGLLFCIIFICSITIASSFGIVGSTHKGLSVTKTQHGPLYASSQAEQPPTPLCELQTFLKLTGAVQTGGQAKTVIQGGECYLNGEVETRRAKKLFKGDEVFFDEKSFDVLDEVNNRGYVYKVKQKKIKPVAKIDAEGNLEFGGQYRSEEWRAERKEKKAAKKADKSKKETE
jgi:ribosome-associated protein